MQILVMVSMLETLLNFSCSWSGSGLFIVHFYDSLNNHLSGIIDDGLSGVRNINENFIVPNNTSLIRISYRSNIVINIIINPSYQIEDIPAKFTELEKCNR